MNRLFVRSIGLVVVIALAGAPALTPAAPSGAAWDSVTKISMSGDSSALQPGSFDDDFATASSAQMQTPSSGGGLFGHYKQMMQMGQNLGAMMQSGLAERHYVAGSKERTDEVGMQIATITDCAARTITTLNLAKKTYRVESMDHPAASSSGGGGGGGSMPKDDGMRVAISVTNKALGSRTVGGQPTRGFSSDILMTETKPSGQSATQHMQMIGYYASFGEVRAQCTRGGAVTGGSMAPGQAMAAMAAAARAMHALASAGLDKRFSLKQSGPPLPAANLAMYQALTFAMQQGRGATFITERGHVRAIDSNDPIFGVPADFTREE